MLINKIMALISLAWPLFIFWRRNLGHPEILTISLLQFWKILNIKISYWNKLTFTIFTPRFENLTRVVTRQISNKSHHKRVHRLHIQYLRSTLFLSGECLNYKMMRFCAKFFLPLNKQLHSAKPSKMNFGREVDTT